MRRVVITGRSAVTAFGVGADVLEDSVYAGRSALKKISSFDASMLPSQIASEVPERNFAGQGLVDAKTERRMDPVHVLAVVSSRLAVKDAKLEGYEPLDLERAGIFIGSGIGGIRTFSDQIGKATIAAQENRLSHRTLSPFFIPNVIPNMCAGLVAIDNGWRGPNFSPVSACATSNHAIGLAYQEILLSRADVMLAGGSESAVNFEGVGGFCAMSALCANFNDEPKRGSRPFDAKRCGFVIGEGCGILVLEELEHAKKRGANILAEIIGFGMSNDAFHLTQPAPEAVGAQIAIRNCIKYSGITLTDVDYINAHGTSTEFNDKTETQGIKGVFGEYAYKLKVSSTKSMVGHLLGAAGAVEAIALIAGFKRNQIHPTINYENPDPECDLDYVPNTAQDYSYNIALSNSFGFGGHNTVLAFKRYTE